jgi:hypothetical protein
MKRKPYAIAILIPVVLLAGVGLSLETGEAPNAGSGETTGFAYDSHARRNPFIPLVVPTQVPTPTPEPEPEAGFLGTLLQAVKPPAPEVSLGQGYVLPTATPTAVFTPTPTPVVPPSFGISATVIGEGRPSMVLIGGNILLVGDVIEGAEITTIEKGRIEILYCGKTFIVESGTQQQGRPAREKPGAASRPKR